MLNKFTGKMNNNYKPKPKYQNIQEIDPRELKKMCREAYSILKEGSNYNEKVTEKDLLKLILYRDKVTNHKGFLTYDLNRILRRVTRMVC